MTYKLKQDDIGFYYEDTTTGKVSGYYIAERLPDLDPSELKYGEPLDRQAALSRIRRQRWLLNPENRKKDAEASRLRAEARRKITSAMKQLGLG